MLKPWRTLIEAQFERNKDIKDVQANMEQNVLAGYATVALASILDPSGGLFSDAALPWCTTPIEAESSLGPDSHHPIILLSGIPSAVMVLRILHPILASTLCAANPLARIAEPTIAL